MSERFYDVILDGALRTRSPVAIVPPGSIEIMGSDGGKHRQVAMRTIYRDGRRDTVPVVTGSTIRGRLRRAAVTAVLAATGARVPLDEWHQNAVGGIKGSGSEDAGDVVFRSLLRERNPIVGLFGASSPWVMSCARIGDAVPVESVEPEVVGSVRSDDGRRDPVFFDRLEEGAVADWSAMVGANAVRTRHRAEIAELRKVLRKEKSAGRRDEAEAVRKQIDQLEDRAREMEEFASNPVSMPLRHAALPAGVEMRHEMVLTGVTEEEIGLFVGAMHQTWRSSPEFGGHANLGYGLIEGEYDVFMDEVGSFDPFDVAEVKRRHLGVMAVRPREGCRDVPAELRQAMSSFRSALEAGRFDFRVAARLREDAARPMAPE